MKKILIIAAAALFTFASCKKDLAEINIDPNRVTETHPQLQLTQIQWNAFQFNAGTESLYAMKMLVQTDGESGGQYYKWIVLILEHTPRCVT